jgi:hypothetical protein
VHKGPVKKAYVHWDWKGSNPFIILIYSTQKHYSIYYNRMKGCIVGGSGKSRTENKWTLWGM